MNSLLVIITHKGFFFFKKCELIGDEKSKYSQYSGPTFFPVHQKALLLLVAQQSSSIQLSVGVKKKKCTQTFQQWQDTGLFMVNCD